MEEEEEEEEEKGEEEEEQQQQQDEEGQEQQQWQQQQACSICQCKSDFFMRVGTSTEYGRRFGVFQTLRDQPIKQMQMAIRCLQL